MPATSKAVSASLVDQFEEPTPEWVYVDIPTRDILDGVFSGVGINFKHYTSDPNRKCDCADAPKCATTGTHKVPPDIGDEIKRRLKAAQAQDVKLFSAKVNLNALSQVLGSNPSYAGNIKDYNESTLAR